MDYSIIGLVLFAAYLGFYRNTQVWRFRRMLAQKCCAFGIADVYADHGNGMWRWDAYDAVSYERMVLMFWKPLRPAAWFSDTSFLESSKLLSAK